MEPARFTLTNLGLNVDNFFPVRPDGGYGVVTPFEPPAIEEYEQTTGINPAPTAAPLGDPFVAEVPSLITRMGAKSQLAAWLVSKFPRCHTYVEPFFGTGKILFAKGRRDRVEIVNDFEADLVEFWRWVTFDPQSLLEAIRAIPTHEAIIVGLRRSLGRQELKGVARAAAWYVGSQSTFNASASYNSYASTPYHLMKIELDEVKLKLVAARLRQVDVRSTDFERVISNCNKELPAKEYPPGGVFFYLDPPYWQTSEYKNMKGEGGFSWDKQVRLAEWCAEIDEVGNRFILTNAAHEDLIHLYGSFKKANGSPRFFLEKRKVRYTISVKSDIFEELILSNFNLQEQKQQSLFGGPRA